MAFDRRRLLPAIFSMNNLSLAVFSAETNACEWQGKSKIFAVVFDKKGLEGG